MLYYIVMVKSLILIISVLLSVAFLTLFEQKILSYAQSRKSPVKVGYKGLLQPFSDALKLFSKEVTLPYLTNHYIYFLSPIMSLGVVLIIWLLYPSLVSVNEISLSIIFMMSCLSVGVYALLGAGWSSNSKFALLGGLRAVAQTISYEVSFSFILLSFIVLAASFEADTFMNFYCSWLGFNTEYSSGPFALFFLAEYGMILFMSMIFSFVFLGGLDLTVGFYIKVCFMLMLFIWVRATLPRLRYDKLMDLSWIVFLPISISYLIFFVGLVSLIGL